VSRPRPRQILSLARFEFEAFWGGPVGALALLVFLGLEGLLFYNAAASYSLANLAALARGGGVDASLVMFASGLGDLGLLTALVTPLATMRAFALSSQGGHLDLIQSWPLSRAELTLGLHLAACASLGLLALLGLAPFVLLMFLGVGVVKTMLVAVLGLALLIAAFSALGLAAASLCRTPMAAALTTLGILGVMWALGWAAPYLPAKAGTLLQGLAFGPRLYHFTRGLIDLNDVIYFLALAAAGLFLARPVR
jgi:ABC-2 type transport system permease protein